MDCGPPVCSVHGILQARILEWVAIPFSRGSSRPRDGNCTAGRFFTSEPPGKRRTSSQGNTGGYRWWDSCAIIYKSHYASLLKVLISWWREGCSALKVRSWVQVQWGHHEYLCGLHSYRVALSSHFLICQLKWISARWLLRSSLILKLYYFFF